MIALLLSLFKLFPSLYSDFTVFQMLELQLITYMDFPARMNTGVSKPTSSEWSVYVTVYACVHACACACKCDSISLLQVYVACSDVTLPCVLSGELLQCGVWLWQ